MEIINYSENRDKTLGWAILVLITQYEKTTGKKFDFKSTNPKALEIEVKIGGHEVPFTQLIERLNGAFNEKVEIKSRELVQEIIEEKYQKVFEVLEDIKTYTEEKFSGLTAEELKSKKEDEE